MANKILLRRDTASNWALVNPILSNGEIGLETDTEMFKIGNGVAPWHERSYYANAQDIAEQYAQVLTQRVAEAQAQVGLAAAQVVLAKDEVIKAATHAQTADNYLQSTIDKASEASTYADEAAGYRDQAATSALYAGEVNDATVAGFVDDPYSDTRGNLAGLFAPRDPNFTTVGYSKTLAYMDQLTSISTTMSKTLNWGNVPAGDYVLRGHVVCDRDYLAGDGATTAFRTGFHHPTVAGSSWFSGSQWFMQGQSTSALNVTGWFYPGYLGAKPLATYVNIPVFANGSQYYAVHGLLKIASLGELAWGFAATVAGPGDLNTVRLMHAGITVTRVA